MRTPTAVVRTGVGLSYLTSCAMRRAREESAWWLIQEATARLMGQVPCGMTPPANFQVMFADGALRRGYGLVILALAGVCRCCSPWASTGS